MAATTAPAAAAAAQPLPLARYVRLAAAVNGVITVIIAFVVAALATSRASAHALSPVALAVLVAAAAGTTGVIGWVNGLAGGVLDRRKGTTAPTCPADPCPSVPAGDPFDSLARDALFSGLLNTAWAAAGGGLLAVALDGRHANLLVTFLALAGLLAMASAATDAVARHRGAHAVSRAGEEAPLALRRRAWLGIAAPLTALQVVVNIGVAVLLFHDYTPGREAGFHILTKTVAMADVPVTVVIVSLVFNLVVSPWGTAEAALGRVDVPDAGSPAGGAAPSPVGVQALIYLALIGLVLGPLFTMLLPDAPSLIWVAGVRAAYAGTLIFLASGLAYVRGALNASAVSA